MDGLVDLSEWVLQTLTSRKIKIINPKWACMNLGLLGQVVRESCEGEERMKEERSLSSLHSILKH